MSEKYFWNEYAGRQGVDGKVRFETRSRRANKFSYLHFDTVWEAEPMQLPMGVAYRDPFAAGGHDGPTLDGVPYKAR